MLSSFPGDLWRSSNRFFKVEGAFVVWCFESEEDDHEYDAVLDGQQMKLSQQ